MGVTATPPKGTDMTDPWPYSSMPEKPLSEGPWMLAMGGSGDLALLPNGTDPWGMRLLHVYSGEKEELEKVFTAFCRLGWEKDARYVHQDGDVWIFNWRCGTLAQVNVAAQIIDKFVNGDVEGARARGRAFEDQVYAAQNAAADAGLVY